MTAKMYQAYAPKGYKIMAPTPRQAAAAFFLHFPEKRKCDIIQGDHDGLFFTITHGNPWPKSWKDVTRKTAADLPDTLTGE